jgi:hypothetical protein
LDRFWIADAQGYSVKPTPDITLSYIRSGVSSEIATPNNIVEGSLIAQRFNSTLSEWDDWTGMTHTDVTSSNTGTVRSGAVPPADFYRSWCLFNDSTTLTSVIPVKNISSVNVFPNPTVGNVTIGGLTEGQVIDLYNDLGQKLSSFVADEKTMHFDIANMANGIYLLRILSKDGSLQTQKKIVKTE